MSPLVEDRRAGQWADAGGERRRAVFRCQPCPRKRRRGGGLKTGDVILNVGGKAVATVGMFARRWSKKATGNHSVQVKTADATRFIAVPFVFK